MFASMPMMSGFMHGSHTSLGGTFDVGGIDIFAWTIHQVMLQNMDCANVTAVKDLQNTPRNRTAEEVAEELMDLYLTQNVTEWQEIFRSYDLPFQFTSFGGIIVTIVTILFEDELADNLFVFLRDIFHLDMDIYDFLMDDVVPEVEIYSQIGILLLGYLHYSGFTLQSHFSFEIARQICIFRH